MTSLPRRIVAGGLTRHWLRRIGARPSLAVGVVVGVIFSGAGGCLHPEVKPTTNKSPAFVMVENHTDYGWRIAFTAVKTSDGSEGGDAAVSWQGLAPREVRRVELAGGVYRVRRALVPEEGGADDDGVELNFQGGKTYVWPLGTLLSTEETSP